MQLYWLKFTDFLDLYKATFHKNVKDFVGVAIKYNFQEADNCDNKRSLQQIRYKS